MTASSITIDAINGVFISAASIFYLLNVSKILEDKKVKGYSLSSLVFFFLWNTWNAVFFSLSDGLIWSKMSSISCALINGVYLFLAIKYRNNE